MNINPTDLLAELGAHQPRLDGAACRANPQLMDADVKGTALPTAIARAQAICHTCPALAPCKAWLDGLTPSLRPYGMVAGVLVRPGPQSSSGGPRAPKNG
ncbi:hypothetical protein VST63_19170 [Mycolicibacterium sp. 050232]|uniref:hypothetical protein n=1 Tax=Mycolicibacterium sp. 050232 TaxID=3113982 RepID=UPI002E2CD79B|nr:hypothetical protein [Mycolicibacterium sp. 050232]MED5814483.1 hypothetical protein [Mycolicibacterium sp. 050232]